MGIPFFSGHLRRRYNKCYYKDRNENDFDIIFVDFNALIYKNIHSESTEDMIIFDTVQYTIDNLIKKYDKSKIYLAVDGVCPMSKMIQQRHRRYMSAIERIKNNDDGFNRASITPGTIFMKKINIALKKLKDFYDNVIVSDSDIEGEGEQKIINYVKRNVKNQKILFVGVDADLIILTMKYTLINVIKILRDDTILDMNMLTKYLLYDIKNDSVIVLKDERILNDLVLLFSLVGNDFVPEIEAFNNNKNIKLNELITYYMNCNKYLVKEDGISINIDKFLDFLEDVKENEYDSNSILVKYRYYNIYNIPDLVVEYMKGLSWTLCYYDKYKCPSWTWYYRYSIAPRITDILNNSDYITYDIFNWSYSNNPLCAKYQLLTVLSKSNLYLLNNNVIEAIAKNSPLYPDETTIKFSKYDENKLEWCKKPFLPNLDIHFIKNLISIFK